ncbi:MAG: glycerophosphodiester phosphodiesterase family protein [Bacteroidetes bacterium]|nr:glycerophosphodiester phosphodiesterase family protein [Bacteroidota bacterium]
MLKRIVLTAAAIAGIIANTSAQETARFKQISEAFLNPNSKVVLICAHRGAHNDYPENSLASFKKAIDLGLDIFELDIRATKDDSLVIMHDKTVDRTTDGHGDVASMTFEEIRKLHLKFNGTVTDEKVPTLEEALNIAKGKILVDLDIKVAKFPEILAVVTRTQSKSSVFALVYMPIYGRMIKEQSPGFHTLIRTNSEAAVDSLFKVTGTEAVHIDNRHNTVAVTTKIKAHGARAFINALDDADKKVATGDLDAYDEDIKNGANIVQTNYPAQLMQYLKKKGLYY